MSLAGTPTQILTCRSCPTRIFFAFFQPALGRAAAAGRPAPKSPIEAEPNPTGDIVILRWAGPTPVVQRLAPDEMTRREGEPRWREHMPYCAGRGKWTRQPGDPADPPGRRRRRTRRGPGGGAR